MKTLLKFLMSLLLLATPLAYGGSVADGDLVTFVPDTTAKAAEVNQNFTALKNGVNGNASDITTLQSQSATAASNISTLQGTALTQGVDISDLQTQTQTLAEQLPGIAVNFSNTQVSLSNTAATAASITVTAPTTGYVLVAYKGLAAIQHTNGTRDMVRIELFNSASNISNGPSFTSYQTPAALPSGGVDIYYSTMNTQRLFAVTPGPHTFYLRADLVAGSSAFLAYNYITAMFVPNLVGTLPSNY